jgi:hypothetical protein
MNISSDSRCSAPGQTPARVIRFVREVATHWDRHLGERLLGVYLIGSLAHGGFSVRYSDIDVALIVQEALTAAELDFVRRRIAARSPELEPRLSLFWADETFAAGRFPQLDRIDYLDHRLPLLERRSSLPLRPTLRAVRDYLGGEPLRNWSLQAMRLSALKELAAEDHKAYLRALLYPARFLYSWETGKVASNDDAVAYVATRTPPNLNVALIKRALECRNAGRDPTLLFAERLQLLSFVDVCARHGGTPPQL